MSIEKRVEYKRFDNGADLYLLKTSVKDVIVCKMAFTGGTHYTYENQTISLLLSEILPGGTNRKKREDVLEKFDELGVKVTVTSGEEKLFVNLSSRASVFVEAFTLLLETLVNPSFSQAEYNIALSKTENKLKLLKENTQFRANNELKRLMYKKGHPHWSPDLKKMQKDIELVAKDDIKNFHKNTFSSIGSIICIVGDIKPKKIMQELSIINDLPNDISKITPKLDIKKYNAVSKTESIIPIKDKMNIDTYVGVPLLLTRDSDEYYAFNVGVSILGSSSTSRLFKVLRTKENLTYGAYAGLEGFSDGYPGYLYARAIFPKDVYSKGKEIMVDIVRVFSDKGVTGKELNEKKEEIAGKYKVGLSTTEGMCSALFATVISKRPVSFMDKYPAMVEMFSTKEINSAIKNNIDFSLVKISASGSVNNKGVAI